MPQNSRHSGFYARSIEERRETDARVSGVDASEFAEGDLGVDLADKLVENTIATFSLPYAVATNARVNGRDVLVPMVTEESSVVAAASNAFRWMRDGEGIEVEVDDPVMVGQIEFRDVREHDLLTHLLSSREREWREHGNRVIAPLIERGGGIRGFSYRAHPEHGRLIVHVHVDVRDAMGANLVNTLVETLGPQMAAASGATLGLCILTNLADTRLVHARTKVEWSALRTPTTGGEELARAVEEASRFAEIDAYRATTHNKGIMNGVVAVALAAGNDTRAIEAGAHAYAARSGAYTALSKWRSAAGKLVGELEMPLAVGSVGGAIRVHRRAQASLRIMRIERASELAAIAAATGLASNLAALVALSSEGIQRGHMSLCARSR